MVFALVFVRGTVNAIDNPSRQAFVSEIVGPDRVVNAVALNSRDRAHRAHRRPGGRRRADRAVRRRRLLRGQRRSRSRAMLVALRLMDPAQLPARRARAARPRPAARRRCAYVRRTPALRIPLAMMVARRHAVVQLPGAAAAAREPDLGRHGGDLRDADRGDGRRLRARRARRGRTRAGDDAAARRQRRAVRRRRAARRGRPDAGTAGAGARPAGRGERHVRGGRQLVAPARRRAR